MIYALVTVFDIAVSVTLFLVAVWAVMSWLIAFDVVNTRNRFVASVWGMLNALMVPLVGWMPRQIRNLGGVDISPIVLFLILTFLRTLVDRWYNTGSFF